MYGNCMTTGPELDEAKRNTFQYIHQPNASIMNIDALPGTAISRRTFRTEAGVGSMPKLHQSTRNRIRLLEVKGVQNGWGRCKSCDCRGFRSNSPPNDKCKDCGHHWTQHT